MNHKQTLGWTIVQALGFLLAMAFCVVVLGLTQNAFGQTWSRDTAFGWDPNSETDLKEYVLYQNGTEASRVPAGTETVTVTITQPGTYNFHLTAVDESMNESDPSNTVSLTLDDVSPENPINLNISVSVTVTVTP